MLVVDAQLDLAYNALRGREVLRLASEQTEDEEGIPSVGLPDLRRGGVGLICATIFCAPSIDGKPGYRDADEANAAAVAQLGWYHRQIEEGTLAPVLSAGDLVAPAPPDRTSSIFLLEGADPIRHRSDLHALFHMGVRIVGLAWKRTRYAGGTGAPGPLTPEGVELVREMARPGVIHYASHLAEESFWQLNDLAAGPVMASHPNCRRIVPTDRQLSDVMIRAIVARGGVIGINLYDNFLLAPSEYGNRRATLADVVRHVEHVCALAGGTPSVGIGTDMDGGLGREQIPQEIAPSAALPRLADALSAADFSDEDVGRVMGTNWLHFFRRSLPRPT